MSSQTGAICLDILKNEWTPALTIRTALISLQALMCSPEPDDPQDAVVANQYKSDRLAFEAKAKEWVSCYAMGGDPKAMPQPVYEDPNAPKIKAVIEFGLSEAEARKALELNTWDV